MSKLFKAIEEENFSKIKDFDYNFKYIDDVCEFKRGYEDFKIAYIDENSNCNEAVVFLIHGFPTWSFLWRHFIKILIEKECRIIAIDLPGFGRSDKPLDSEFYNFSNYRNIILKFIEKMSLSNITLITHEMGGTLGMTLPMTNPTKFKAAITLSSFLPNNFFSLSDGYLNWLENCKKENHLNVRALMARTNRILNLSECNAYAAPFSNEDCNYVLKKFPSIFPANENIEGFDICREAVEWWQEVGIDKSLLVTGGRDPLFTIENAKQLAKIISSDDNTHVINNAGHFVPEWGMEFGKELFDKILQRE